MECRIANLEDQAGGHHSQKICEVIKPPDAGDGNGPIVAGRPYGEVRAGPCEGGGPAVCQYSRTEM